MIIILLTGVSGTGKTHFRNEHLSQIPYVDLADIHRDKPFIPLGAPSARYAYQCARRMNAPCVAIEGYFLNRSPSTAELHYEARKNGDKMVRYHFDADPETIIKRLTMQKMMGEPDIETRLKMASRCHEVVDEPNLSLGVVITGEWWADQASSHSVYCNCDFCLRYRYILGEGGSSRDKIAATLRHAMKTNDLEIEDLDDIAGNIIDDVAANMLFRLTGLPPIYWKVLGDIHVPRP